MPLSSRDLARLGAVRPELLNLLTRLADDAQQFLGLTVHIPADGGTRTQARQDALYADSLRQGGGTLAYPVAPGATSRHLYGAAFDLVITAGGANADGTGTDADYRDLADVGSGDGLTAGYYFARSDPYHFELSESLTTSIANAGNVVTPAGSSMLWIAIAIGAGVVYAVARR